MLSITPLLYSYFVWMCTIKLDVVALSKHDRDLMKDFDLLEVTQYQVYTAELERLQLLKHQGRVKMKALADNIKKLKVLYNKFDPFVQTDDPVCERYLAEGRRRATVHIYDVLEPSYSNDHIHDIVYVSQMRWTDKKAAVLRTSIDAWKGPMSIAIYIEPQDVKDFIYIMSLMLDDIDTSRVHIHLAMGNQEFYPINYMRNVALNATKHYDAEYVYLIDIDLMGPDDLYATLQSYSIQKRVPKDGVLIIPAFQFMDTIAPMPQTKRDFLKLYKDKIITPFISNVNNIHKPTRYDIWVNAKEEYEIVFKYKFEPYVLIRSSQCPHYEEGFIGRGSDKYSQLLETYAKGLSFSVIPDGWAIHYPHPTNLTPPELKCGHAHLLDFISDLEWKYKRFHLPPTEDFSNVPGWDDDGSNLVHLN